MNLSKVVTFFILLIISLASLEARVLETNRMSDLLQEIDDNTVVFFDIDDTLIYIPTMMGNSVWWNYCQNVASKNNWDQIKVATVLWPLLHQAAIKVKTELVDETAPELIKGLQDRGIPVFGLTARSRQILGDYAFDMTTILDLSRLGIIFTQTEIDMPALRGGVLFTNTQLKGPFVERFLKKLKQKKTKVVFIDDNLYQVQSVDSCMATLKIPTVCFRYSKMDKAYENFDPTVANIQLKGALENETIFTNEQASDIADHLKISDPHFYLRYLIENDVKPNAQLTYL